MDNLSAQHRNRLRRWLCFVCVIILVSIGWLCASHEIKRDRWARAKATSKTESIANVLRGKVGLLGNEYLSWLDVFRIRNVAVRSPQYASDIVFEERLLSTSPTTVNRTTTNWLGDVQILHRIWSADEVIARSKQLAEIRDKTGVFPKTIYVATKPR